MSDTFDPKELDDLLLPSPTQDEDPFQVPALLMVPLTFLLQSTILYGGSKTGKSTIIYHIFKILQRYIPIFVVISPTAASNGDYDGRVPALLIFKNPTKDVFRDVYFRQEAAAAFYRRANNIPVLAGLYAKIKDHRTDGVIKTIMTKRSIAVRKARAQYGGDSSKLDEEVRAIKSTYDETLRNVYRVVIRKHKAYLEKQNLNDKEIYCLKYLDFNPNLGLIVDDCAAQIKQWGKDETVSKIFYQGRHNYITSIYTFQHDKLLDSNFRQNAFVSIFTEDKAARAYFGRQANNFDKDEIKKAAEYIKKVYKKKFYKLVYVRESKQPYQYIKADLFPKFRVCFPYVWKYCELVESDEDHIDEDNPFMKNFLLPKDKR